LTAQGKRKLRPGGSQNEPAFQAEKIPSRPVFRAPEPERRLPPGGWRKEKKSMRSKRLALVLSALLLVSAAAAQRIDLHDGWQLDSSCKMKDAGAAISTAAYHAAGWLPAAAPTTVLAAQVAQGEFREPYYAMKLREIPGTSYPILDLFSHYPMPADSPYACSWWYRTTFATPARPGVVLHFDGINYRANVWLNGKKIADANDVAGAYRTYAFDVSELLEKGHPNALAVEVFAPSEKELGINWVDWNPAPADKDMGLWGKVYLEQTGGVELRSPAVATHFTGSDVTHAELTVTVELHNASGHEVAGVLHAALPELKLRVEQAVTLAAGETRAVSFAPADYAALKVSGAEPWWPRQMGKPRLYTLETSYVSGSAVMDRRHTRVGLREITSELTASNARLFRVNGKPILIRGGGWAPDMMLRSSPERLEAELAYVQAMNLNTLRLEGKMETDDFFRRTDELGILVMAGWCCCDVWEKWADWHDGQLAVAAASVRSQAMRLRSHPSMMVWLNGSDNPPPAEVEKAYIQALEDARWPNPYLSSASEQTTTVTGKSGVKMTGPYDYVPPAYWELDKNKQGGAWGFNTETGPGAALPVKESLAKFLPEKDRWPTGDATWNYHVGLEGFPNLNIFEGAMKAEYGEAKNLDEYEAKSQAMAYDGERAMFEAYSRNKYTSTGVIQWMLNNAWPSVIWHLYDYYLQPAGGYFGTKKANEPLHIQYGYDNREISVVNSTYQPAAGLKASVRAYDLQLREAYRYDGDVAVEADGVKAVTTIPELPGITGTYFLRLELRDARQRLVSTNFYWLSTQQPEMNWAKTTYINTPVTTHPDLTLLNDLPRTEVEAVARLEAGRVRVKLHNPSKQLAFQVALAVENKTGAEILPVLWEDNYISLLPGETREVEARFPQQQPAAGARVAVSGWNIAAAVVKLLPAAGASN
jgi:exo-1,4-beta-D-glucosaminidase